jgi:hypothetical protein
VPGIHAESLVREDVLGIQPIRNSVAGLDIFQEIKNIMSKYYLNSDKLHRLSTDGAIVMKKKNCFRYRNKS